MESIAQHYLFKIHLKFSLSEKFSLSVTPLCGWEIWMLYQLGPWSPVGLNVLGRFWVKDHTATPGPLGFGSWTMGLCPIPVKTIMTETRHLFRDSNRKNEEAIQVTILMTFTL